MVVQLISSVKRYLFGYDPIRISREMAFRGIIGRLKNIFINTAFSAAGTGVVLSTNAALTLEEASIGNSEFLNMTMDESWS